MPFRKPSTGKCFFNIGMSPKSKSLSGSLRLESAFVNIEMSPRCEVPGARLTNGATLTGRIPSYVVETEIVTTCLSDPKD